MAALVFRAGAARAGLIRSSFPRPESRHVRILRNRWRRNTRTTDANELRERECDKRIQGTLVLGR